MTESSCPTRRILDGLELIGFGAQGTAGRHVSAKVGETDPKGSAPSFKQADSPRRSVSAKFGPGDDPKDNSPAEN